MLASLIVANSAHAQAAPATAPVTSLKAAGDTPPSGEILGSIAQRLNKGVVLRGKFTQKKTVAGFKKPLESSGQFVLSRDKGVLWTTLLPFPQQLKVTNDGIRASQNGVVTMTLDARKEPSVSLINHLLTSVLSGDVARLSDAFVVTGTNAAGAPGAGQSAGPAWHLTLMPRDAGLAHVFQSISLDGDRFVRVVGLSEANGDQTQIELSDQSTEPSQLSPKEISDFG